MRRSAKEVGSGGRCRGGPAATSPEVSACMATDLPASALLCQCIFARHRQGPAERLLHALP